MKARSLFVLAGCAVAMAGAAYYAVQESTLQPPETRRPVYDGLQVDSISQITITDANNATTAIRQADGLWGIQERDGYPADIDRVRQAILGTARLEVIEPRSSNSELYERLWLQDTSVDGSRAIRLTLNTQDGTILADFLRGKSDWPVFGWRDGTLFLRKFGQAQSWLVGGRLSLGVRTTQWLHPDMPKITRERIRRIEVVHPDEADSFHIERTEPTQDTQSDTSGSTFEIYPPPSPNVEVNRSSLEGLEQGFAFLLFQDVARVDSVNFTQSIATTAHTFDGLRITAFLVQQQENWWIKFDFGFELGEVEGDGTNEESALAAPTLAATADVTPAVDGELPADGTSVGESALSLENGSGDANAFPDKESSSDEAPADEMSDPLSDEAAVGEISDGPPAEESPVEVLTSTETPSLEISSLVHPPGESLAEPLGVAIAETASAVPAGVAPTGKISITVPESTSSETTQASVSEDSESKDSESQDPVSESSEGEPEVEDESSESSEVALEVQRLQQRFSPWAYRISESTVKSLNKRLTDLFKDG